MNFKVELVLYTFLVGMNGFVLEVLWNTKANREFEDSNSRIIGVNDVRDDVISNLLLIEMNGCRW